MESRAPKAKPQEHQDAIAGNRRLDRRYQLNLDLKWKLIRRRRMLDTGAGHTVDVSSGGILFDAGRHLPEGLNVELSIAWPVLLRNVAPMQLVAVGKVVRCEGRMVAIRTTQYEFRTAGTSGEQRTMVASATEQPAILAMASGERTMRAGALRIAGFGKD
jgi:hypothetical protein